MARKSVDIEQQTLEYLFSEENYFIVPLFQREYKWTEEEGLEDFWNDLIQHYNDETERKTP